MVAANYTYNALKPDGTNIGSFNAPGAAVSVRGKRKVQFDTSKMSFIGAQTITRIVGFRGDSGTTDLNSFVNATKKHLVGLQAADTPYYEAFYRIMGIDFQVFSAYPRFAQRLQALRTGEINTTPFAHLTWVQNLSTYKKSDFHAVYQMGYMDGSGEIVPVTVGGMDKVPTGHSIVKKYKPDAVGSRDWKIMTSVAAGQGVAREVWAPPGTDAKYVEAWRKAFVATANDARYKATGVRFNFHVHWIAIWFEFSGGGVLGLRRRSMRFRCMRLARTRRANASGLLTMVWVSWASLSSR